MSMCITSTCAHDRDVFIWVADGPWFGDASDPDSGRYPWVHATSSSPGHLEVCDLKPFAAAEEAGEVCACGHESRRHEAGPVSAGRSAASLPCLDCGCGDFRHRPEDLARERGARTESAPVPPAAHVPDCVLRQQLELFPLPPGERTPTRSQRAARKGVWTVPATGGLL